VYYNNFINNTDYLIGGVYNAGYPRGGNYWSHYEGIDSRKGINQSESGSDGIIDSPLKMPGFQGVIITVDSYPLAAPISHFDVGLWENMTDIISVVSNSTISEFHFNPDEGPFLRFKVTGDNGTDGFCRVEVPKTLLWTETEDG
jgi:hypothetical protein